jgi:hypothetical protein
MARRPPQPAALPVHAIHRNAVPERQLPYRTFLEDFRMISDPSEAAIDQIVATCNGDIRGALKALLMVNEQLEAELQQLYAAVAHGGLAGRGSSVLH